MNATKKKYCIQFRSFYFILLASFIPFIASAACTNDDLKKMVEAKLSLEDINRICGKETKKNTAEQCLGIGASIQPASGGLGGYNYYSNSTCSFCAHPNQPARGCCASTLKQGVRALMNIPVDPGTGNSLYLSGQAGWVCVQNIPKDKSDPCYQYYCGPAVPGVDYKF